MIRTAADIIQRGLEKLDIDFDLKRNISKQLPKLAKRVVGALTGSEIGEDIAEKIMKGLLVDESNQSFAGEEKQYFVRKTDPISRDLEHRAISEQQMLT